MSLSSPECMRRQTSLLDDQLVVDLTHTGRAPRSASRGQAFRVRSHLARERHRAVLDRDPDVLDFAISVALQRLPDVFADIFGRHVAAHLDPVHDTPHPTHLRYGAVRRMALTGRVDVTA